MSKPRSVSESELAVLEALWKIGSGSVRDVRRALDGPVRRWAYTTVKTLLDRLEEKKCVRRDRSQRAHRFEPIVTREELARRGIRELVDTVGGGSASPLLRALIGDARLTPAEARELRRLLQEKEGKEA